MLNEPAWSTDSTQAKSRIILLPKMPNRFASQSKTTSAVEMGRLLRSRMEESALDLFAEVM